MLCSICLLEIINQNYTTLCGHSFHKNCLSGWFNEKLYQEPTCPMCRTNIIYDRGIVEYWTGEAQIIQRIQNRNEDRSFYANGKIRYLLKLDRTQNNKITGGKIYKKFRFDKDIEINELFIRDNCDKILKMQQDINYDIYEDL